MKDFDSFLNGRTADILIVVILGLAIYGLFSLVIGLLGILLAAGL